MLYPDSRSTRRPVHLLRRARAGSVQPASTRFLSHTARACKGMASRRPSRGAR